MATLETARALFLALPGVEEGPSYGTPGFRVAKKFVARALGRQDGKTLVLRLRDDNLRDALLENEPEVFFLTDHYRGYPAILVRLPKITRARLAELIEIAWRGQATQKLLTAFQEEAAPAQTRTKTKKTTKKRGG